MTAKKTYTLILQNLIVITGLFWSSIAQGQHSQLNQKHQFGIAIGAGIYSTVGKLPLEMEKKGQAGFSLEADYQYNLAPNWGISLGIGYEYAQIQYGKKALENREEYIDLDGESFTFQYHTQNYRETWSMQQINLPVMIEYSGAGKTAFYAKTGIKYSMQLKNEVEMHYSALQTSGYFPQWQLELTEPEFAGFGKFDRFSAAKEIKLHNRWAWIAEAGIKQKLTSKQKLYIGLYLDLGLNDQSKAVDKSQSDLLIYNPEPGNALKPMSLAQTNGKYKSQIKTYALGIKIKYAF